MELMQQMKLNQIKELFENKDYVSRQELNEYFESDTEMRDFIRDMFFDYIIINNQDGKGYFHPKDMNDKRIDNWVSQEYSRGISILRKVQHTKKLKVSAWQQDALNRLLKYCEEEKI